MRVGLAFVLVAAVAGCGSEPTFAERGNAICRETKTEGLGTEGLRRLEALEPPASLRRERDRFFADVRALAGLAPIDTAAKRAKARALIDRLPDEARALGWTECAG